MTTVAILASSRSFGNTRSLVDLAFPVGSVAFEDLGKLKLGFYAYDASHDDDDCLPLIGRLMQHDTWVLATPLYWYTMSAQAKTFVDRLSGLLDVHASVGRQLRGKNLAVLCSGTDPAAPLAFDEAFKLTSSYLGMHFLGTHYAQFQESCPTS